jgi:hypothetical protein
MNHHKTLISRPVAWLIIFTALLFASTASALPPTPLAPGTTQYNPALNPPFSFFTPNYVSGPLPANYVLVTSHDFPYNYNGTKDNSFVGFVRSSVYKNTTDNTLAFTYTLNNLTPFAGAPLTDIVRATINDPSDPWFDPTPQPGFPLGKPVNISAAGSDPNSGGHSTAVNGFFGGWTDGTPFDLVRSATDYGVAVELNPLNSGTQLNQPSTNPMSPNGDQSALVWFTTDATKFNVTNVSLSDNGHVGTGQAYAPSTVQGPFVPEPASLVLLSLGCLGGAVTWWRRRHKS